jgi:two-component system, NtrC family, response regulator
MVGRHKILVADDDLGVRKSLSFLLEKAGYEVLTASDPLRIMEIVREGSVQLIILDMNYSYKSTGDEGLDLIPRIKVFCPTCPIILITAWGSVELAVKGIKAGAYDFITKPWNNRFLLNLIETALELGNGGHLSENFTREELNAAFNFDSIVGTSPQLVKLLQTVSRIAGTHAPVLITGESGTGKELIAEAIHSNSRRRNKPFVKVNLGGLSSSLFESEMFGHKKGAFTDAYTDRAGRFMLADGGTIFLDEIGELDLSSQVKLLRVLQELAFEPLGDSHTVNVDVRVLCATNRNIPDMVSKGTFREDLFYRINLIQLEVAPLRERISDIPLLAGHFMEQTVLKYGVPDRKIKASSMDFLKRQKWPGNIRELKNLVERTVLMVDKSSLDEEDFREAMLSVEMPARDQDKSARGVKTLDEVQKEAILKAMKDCANNLSMVAKMLGISRATLYRKLDKYNISNEG